MLSLNSRQKLHEKFQAEGHTKDVKIVLPLKYLSNFWRSLKMPLINCEVNLILNWLSACVISNSTDMGTFAITDTKIHVPVETFSAQDNAKLLE